MIQHTWRSGKSIEMNAERERAHTHTGGRRRERLLLYSRKFLYGTNFCTFCMHVQHIMETKIMKIWMIGILHIKSKYRTSYKNSALLIIRHPLPNDWKSSLIIRQRSSRVHVYAIYGNRMRTRMEYWTLTSKNLVKLKRDYYFHAEFLEEVRYTKIYSEGSLARCIKKLHQREFPAIRYIVYYSTHQEECKWSHHSFFD